ncbi:unnamed protein product, partial [Meganyctiphanes norvegica]
RYLETSRIQQLFKTSYGNAYVNLSYAASLNELYIYFLGFLTFIGIIKFLKLLRFNRNIGILGATIVQCWNDLSGFLFSFFICFGSFVMGFYLLLNKDLDGFYNFITSIETCFSMMLGRFQFEDMRQVSALVPFLFVVFVCINSWILINMMLTIILKSYALVRYELWRQPNDYEIIDFMWGRFMALMGRGKATKAAPDQSPDQSQEPQDEFPKKLDDLSMRVD